MKTNKKCIVITPTLDRPERATEDLLRQLNLRGYHIHISYGCSSVNLVRSKLASMALREGFEEILWIDHDMTFDVEDVEKLREHNLPIVAGAYGGKLVVAKIMVKMPPGDHLVLFGKGGGLIEVEIAPGGFLYTKREVYETIKRDLQLPDCVNEDGFLFSPYFIPFTVPNNDGTGTHAYLIDDGAFCTRARQVGYKIFIDTTIRLGHIGKYEYSWEEITDSKKRIDSVTFALHEKWPILPPPVD